MSTHECRHGYICGPRSVYQLYDNGKTIPLISKKFLNGENAIDIVTHYDEIYVLLEGGDILRIVDRAPIKIESEVAITRIFSFDNHLYGLSNGYLYRHDENTYSDNYWQWKHVDNMPPGLKSVSVTLNGEYVWLETNNNGYLFDRSWNIVEKVDNKKFKERIYGYSCDIWIDFFSDYGLVSDGRRITKKIARLDIHNQVVTLDKRDVYQLRLLSYKGQYVTFFILDRGCISG